MTRPATQSQDWRKRLKAACLALLAGAPLLAGAAVAQTTQAAQLRLSWEVERTIYTPPAQTGRSRAALTLTNLDSKPLPARGWAIYFNAMAGVESGPALEGQVGFEQVGGTLYRMLPMAGFGPLGGGQSARIVFMHPEVMLRTDKAPKGPYLVFDSAPEAGLAIADYRIVPPSRPEQLDTGPADSVPFTTAEAVYKSNLAIVDMSEDALPPVFPTPRHSERRGGSLYWRSLPAVIGPPALRNEVAFARALLKPYFAPGPASPDAPALKLRIAPVSGQKSPEAYELAVDPVAGIVLTGNTAAGVARGLQSLRELLPLHAQPDRGLQLPALSIADAPRFEYRGLMLDVARNFQDKATVFRLLDLMARYKLNKFHFHLTDDEGWRLEIAGIPELTAFGARRGHTSLADKHLQPAHGSGPDARDPHGSGYYSRADYIEILKYAAARHIEVIPEIEMPGHARAAVKAMESRARRLARAGRKDARGYLISDPEDRSRYTSAQLFNDNVMNPGLPSTYAFIEKVVAEIAAMHRQAGVPPGTLHVGGDEVPNGAWEKSPAVHALMKDRQLAGLAEAWDYFYNRVDAILRKHGMSVAGWEELGARKAMLRGEPRMIPNPEFVRRGYSLYVWNNLDGAEDLAYRLANAGYRTVLAPATTLYFDMAHNKNPEEPGHDWAAYVDLDTVYGFIPFDYIRKSPTDPRPLPGKEGLTDYGQRNIRGLEGTLFSETMRDPARIDYLLMPRMLGLAERAWAPDPAWARERDPSQAARLHAAAWSSFANLLGKRVLPRLAADHPDLAYRIPPPGLKAVDGRVLANHQLPGFTMRYTADGSEPGAASAVVSGPITDRGIVQVAAFDRNGRRGGVSRIDNR